MVEEIAMKPLERLTHPATFRTKRIAFLLVAVPVLATVASKAYRAGKLPFPNGTIIARLAWSYDASEENNKTFGRPQSFVAGAPKNGVQFMVKDSRRYASTGGWGFAHFDDGKPADAAMLQTCFPCHQAIKARDFVFTQYAR
jgi:hypothetical protein